MNSSAQAEMLSTCNLWSWQPDEQGTTLLPEVSTTGHSAPVWDTLAQGKTGSELGISKQSSRGRNHRLLLGISQVEHGFGLIWD
jgi:hypothetical protein